MKLNLDIIAQKLSTIYSVSRLGAESQGLSLRRPVFYRPDTTLVPDRLYIFSTQQLPTKLPAAPCAFVCCGSQLPRGGLSGGHQILSIREPVDPNQVFAQIQQIYDQFDDWDTAIRDQLEQTELFDLKEVIRIGVQILENPICVSNQFLQFLYTSQIITRPDGSREIIVEDTPAPLPLDGLDNIKEYSRKEREIRKPYLTAARVISPPENHKTYCNNLYPMDHFAGCVYLKEVYHPFQPCDYQLADWFFSYFQKAYIKYLHRAGHRETPQSLALSRLLDGWEIFSEEQKCFLLQPGESWRCFKLTGKRNASYMPADYMCAVLNTMLPTNVCAVLHHQEIVGILREGGTTSANGSHTMFRKVLERMEYTAGISVDFSDIHQVPWYMHQAYFAADELKRAEKSSALQFFEHGFFQYFLTAVTGEFPLEALFSRPLRLLLEHDQEKGTEYVHTLKVLLDNELNMTKAAEQLYIHRTSLIKRLERMEKIAGDLLREPDDRLSYRLCLRLLETRDHLTSSTCQDTLNRSGIPSEAPRNGDSTGEGIPR